MFQTSVLLHELTMARGDLTVWLVIATMVVVVGMTETAALPLPPPLHIAVIAVSSEQVTGSDATQAHPAMAPLHVAAQLQDDDLDVRCIRKYSWSIGN